MALNHSNTDTDSRKHGQHLSLAERGAIQALQRQDLPLRAIAAQIGCVNILAQGNRVSGLMETVSPDGGNRLLNYSR